MSRRLVFISIFIICVVVLVTYQASLSIGFFGDDWTFAANAAALPVPAYLASYFNPFTQSHWYRPIQGLQYLIEYYLSGSDATAYHWGHILLHLANSLLLYGLVAQITKNWRIGFMAALVFAGFSVFGWSVLWPADAAPLETFFYFSALTLWWRHLQHGRWFDAFGTVVAFLFAIMSREPSITLPVTLFLMDRLLVRQPTALAKLIWRYLPFACIGFLFMLVEYNISLHALPETIHLRYSIGPHLVPNLLYYLGLLVYPWALPSPFAIAWLAIATGLFVIVMWRRKSFELLFLGMVGVLGILPFVPFTGEGDRYFYMSSAVTAVLLALLLENFRQHVSSRKAFAILSALASLLLIGNVLAVNAKALGLVDLARYGRTPLRAVAEKHPTLPQGTYLYFINPSWSSADMWGMFLLRYGTSVSVRGTDLNSKANFRSQQNALVMFPGEGGQLREQPVDQNSKSQISPALPVTFGAGIQLDGYELVRGTSSRSDSIILMLYWQAQQKIEQNYTRFVHLVDSNGNMIDGFDSQPRDNASPVSGWKVGQTMVDWVILPLGQDVPTGIGYHLEVGWYDSTTMQRLNIVGVDSDVVKIAPLTIVE